MRPLVGPALPWLREVPEVNVRTYVVGPGGRPGVWFFSLDIATPDTVAAARAEHERWPLRHATVRELDDRLLSRRGFPRRTVRRWRTTARASASGSGSPGLCSYTEPRGRLRLPLSIVRGDVHRAARDERRGDARPLPGRARGRRPGLVRGQRDGQGKRAEARRQRLLWGRLLRLTPSWSSCNRRGSSGRPGLEERPDGTGILRQRLCRPRPQRAERCQRHLP